MAIDTRYFTHPSDQKALSALQSIPGFTPLLKGFLKIFNERTWRIQNMSGSVRLSPEQMPRVYNLLGPICEKLEIEEIPELYLKLDPNPNAWTSGDTQIFITVTSGLLEYLTDEELQVCLAHECGHIVCHHVLYQTMGQLILNGTAAALGLGGLVTSAIQIAIAYWMRCSEFSADRAAAMFAEKPEPVEHLMLRFAGAGKDLEKEISLDLFRAQADEYRQYVDDSRWNKVLEFLVLANQSHPLTAVRAAEIRKWCETEDFRALCEGEPYHSTEVRAAMQAAAADEPEQGVLLCPNCGTRLSPDDRFCYRCGTRIRRCPQCGRVAGIGETFCISCGTKLDE